MHKKIIENKSLILMVLILLFALLLRLVFFTGIGSSDSLFYTEFADKISKNEPDLDGSHLGLRIGILYPVALLYSIFGVNEFSSNIFILLISLGSIILIYNFGKLLFNEKVGLLSAFLLSFFPFDVVYSTRLLTDVSSAFFVALSVYFFLKSEKISKKFSSEIYCFFSGLSLGIAYLMRELSLLIGLFFLIYMIYNKKIKIGYSLIGLGFILVFSMELWYFLSLTGNPFFRFSVVNSSWVSLIVETNMYGRGDFPSGLFHYPYIIFTDSLISLFYMFIFIAIFYCIKNKKNEAYSLLFWFAPILLYLSFGSANLTQYILFPATARMLSIITIPGLLILAYFLAQDDPLIKRVLAPSIITLLFITSIGFVYISDQRFAIDGERAAYKYLETLPEKEIYTDSRSIMIFDYLSGYNADNINSFNSYVFRQPENTYALDLSQIKDSYVAINQDMINILTSTKKGIVFPDEIYDVPAQWILEKEIPDMGKGSILIYYVP